MEEKIYREINDCRPQVIEHFVGQSQVVKRCKVALEASWNQGTKLPHMLMQSGPGLGKTELSCILANEVGMEDGPHEQLAQNIRTPADLHALLLTPKDKEVCLIDEIHGKVPTKYSPAKKKMGTTFRASGDLYYLIFDDAIIFGARVRLLPIARQQLVNFVSRMRTDFFKHISKIHKRVNSI